MTDVIRMTSDGKAMFWCPACQMYHGPRVIGERGEGPLWTWNGDKVKPTFSPSILVRGTQRLTDEELAAIKRGEKIEPRTLLCHSFVRDGVIEFCSDSQHEMAGKSVKLEPDE